MTDTKTLCFLTLLALLIFSPDARDVRTRGRSIESVVRQFDSHVQPMHELYVEPQRQWASCCVNSPLSDSDQSELIAACSGI